MLNICFQRNMQTRKSNLSPEPREVHSTSKQWESQSCRVSMTYWQTQFSCKRFRMQKEIKRMTFYALSSSQLCLIKGDRRTSLAHWMAILRAFNFSWMQHSCSRLVERCSSRLDNWLNCPSFLFFKDIRSFHQKHLRQGLISSRPHRYQCHRYQFSTAWEALSTIFWISLSSRALSLSICSSRPAARVCRSDPGHFICVLISNFLWCVCVLFVSRPHLMDLFQLGKS